MCDYCSWIEKLLRPPRHEALPTVCTNIINDDGKGENVEKTVKFDPTILVHGTANSMSSREEINALLERIEEATIEAYRELIKGAETVDSVELAIRHLESQESIEDSGDNANERVKNKISVIRDAAIMDSSSNVGSVGALINVHHPITLAKKVLQNTDHVLIVESGIRNLEIETIEACRTDDFSEEKIGEDSIESKIVDNSEKRIENKKNHNGLKIYGAIARDRKGRLSCGISTFDDRDEIIARSSMSASGTVVGCGIFADDESCCTVSGTDTAIYAYAPARKIIESLRRHIAVAKRDNTTDLKIEELLKDELKKFVETTGETSIGTAALRIEGEAHVAFGTNYFPWACCNRGIITSGCVKDEIFTRDVEDLDMPLDCECH